MTSFTRKIALCSFLLFSFNNSLISFNYSKFNFLTQQTASVLCIGYMFVGCFNNFPYLFPHDDLKNGEDYLYFLQDRIRDLESLTASNLSEENLKNVKQSLIHHYSIMLKNRSLLSKILYRVDNTLPWALLNEEIKHHKSELDSYLNYRNCPHCKSHTFKEYVCDYSQDLFNNMQKILNTLNQILINIQWLPEFQNECSLARQEMQITKIQHLVMVAICMNIVLDIKNSLA